MADYGEQYAFILSAAFSAGVAISGLVAFFSVQLPGIKVKWWGNSVIWQGCEAQTDPCRLMTVPEGEYFGPRYGEFS